MDQIKYFGYSSTLKEDHMRDNGVETEKLENVVLWGWKLVFSVHLEHWDSGVADIIPDKPENRVEGVLYLLDDESLKNLDDYFGRAIAADKEVGNFRRQYIHIEVEGEVQTVLTHIGNKVPSSKGKKDPTPTEEYMDLLIEGAREQGSSSNYIEELRTYKNILTIPLEEE